MEPPRTILVIDNDPLIIEAFRKFLQREGHRMLDVGGISEALERVNQERIDLVIADADIADLPVQVLSLTFKKIASQIPVIVISSSPSEDTSLADIFFCKPLELRLIREGMNNLLRR